VTTIPPSTPDDQDPTETMEIPGLLAPGEPGPARAGGYALIVASGPQRGMHWLLSDGTEAGRHPEAEIFLDDVTVSRRHCLFALSDGALEIRDLGSTNGTYVNGVRCEQARLRVGDQVIIGRFHLVVARDS
jgi:pSer/pThr/pTyr-binding forkhead associated (FHA) protein